jgi:solute carrier family 5 (sodium-coupled monocarboxylate transporter), member 8/12
MLVLEKSKKYFFSFISGISLLGIPTEVYIYGIGYFYIMGGIILMGFVMMEVYLPVFHDLKLTSTYQVTHLREVLRICSRINQQITFTFSIFKLDSIEK